MLSFLSNTRGYLAAGATDQRKSFDTLAGVVRNSLRLDPLSGHIFVFTNARENRLKILFWDKTGWWVCAKRLEVGTYPGPPDPPPDGAPGVRLHGLQRPKPGAGADAAPGNRKRDLQTEAPDTRNPHQVSRSRNAIPSAARTRPTRRNDHADDSGRLGHWVGHDTRTSLPISSRRPDERFLNANR